MSATTGTAVTATIATAYASRLVPIRFSTFRDFDGSGAKSCDFARVADERLRSVRRADRIGSASAGAAEIPRRGAAAAGTAAVTTMPLVLRMNSSRGMSGRAELLRRCCRSGGGRSVLWRPGRDSKNEPVR